MNQQPPERLEGKLLMCHAERFTSHNNLGSHLDHMTPREKYGAEFYCEPHIFKKADGSEHLYYDIGVCITKKQDAPTTLEYAWGVLRELAAWACEEFKDHPSSETYRVTVAWSKSVRESQGHIVKVWNDLAGLREVAGFATPQDCAARFGPGWTPFGNWQKDVFEQKAHP